MRAHHFAVGAQFERCRQAIWDLPRGFPIKTHVAPRVVRLRGGADQKGQQQAGAAAGSRARDARRPDVDVHPGKGDDFSFREWDAGAAQTGAYIRLARDTMCCGRFELFPVLFYEGCG